MFIWMANRKSLDGTVVIPLANCESVNNCTIAGGSTADNKDFPDSIGTANHVVVSSLSGFVHDFAKTIAHE